MKFLKKIIKHLAIVFVTLVIIIGTLFIKQSVEFPERKIELGYPIHFWTLDFSGNRGGTTMNGSPDIYLKNRKFNILSSWEEYVETSWINFILSYLIIFFIIEGVVLLINRSRPPTSKK